MATPVVPQSRLDATSRENSEAIAEQRRAVTAERQAMAQTRSLQRAYRRARRQENYGAMATIGQHLSKDLGVSPLSGGGIQSAQENDRQAETAAVRRAAYNNETAAKMAEMGGDIERDAAKAAPAPVAGAAGSPTADTSSPAYGPKRPAGFGPVAGDTRGKFISDLDRSELVKTGDSDAIERAAARGSKFGISKEQIQAYSQGEDATPSGIASRKAAASARSVQAAEEMKPAEAPSDLYLMADGLNKKNQALKAQIAEGAASAMGGTSIEEIANNSPIPEPVISGTSRQRQVLDETRAKRELIQRQADIDQVNYASAPIEGMTPKDPRYKAAVINRDADLMSSGAGRTKAFKQDYMIRRAIREGVDISGFTLQDPFFHAAYQDALGQNREMKESSQVANNIAKQWSNVLPK